MTGTTNGIESKKKKKKKKKKGGGLANLVLDLKDDHRSSNKNGGGDGGGMPVRVEVKSSQNVQSFDEVMVGATKRRAHMLLELGCH